VSFLLEPRREGNPTLLVLVLEGEEGGMPGRLWLLEPGVVGSCP
jgi:hypothetical protein